jgi:hypothetical protein
MAKTSLRIAEKETLETETEKEPTLYGPTGELISGFRQKETVTRELKKQIPVNTEPEEKGEDMTEPNTPEPAPEPQPRPAPAPEPQEPRRPEPEPNVSQGGINWPLWILLVIIAILGVLLALSLLNNNTSAGVVVVDDSAVRLRADFPQPGTPAFEEVDHKTEGIIRLPMVFDPKTGRDRHYNGPFHPPWNLDTLSELPNLSTNEVFRWEEVVISGETTGFWLNRDRRPQETWALKVEDR